MSFGKRPFLDCKEEEEHDDQIKRAKVDDGQKKEENTEINDEKEKKKKDEEQEDEEAERFFSMVISQVPVVEILIEYGVDPRPLRRATATMYRTAIFLKSLEEMIAPVYGAKEWANAIVHVAHGEDAKSAYSTGNRQFRDEYSLSVCRGSNDVVILTLSGEEPFAVDLLCSSARSAESFDPCHVDCERDDDFFQEIGCGCCRVRTIEEHLRETRTPCSLMGYFELQFFMRDVVKLQGTPLEHTFETCSVDQLSSSFDRAFRFDWQNGEYLCTLRHTTTIRARPNASPPSVDQIAMLLEHAFKPLGVPLANSVHTVATECFMLAQRFARQQLVSPRLLCTAVRALIRQRTARGIEFARRLKARCASTCIAVVERRSSDRLVGEIDDERAARLTSWDFNVELQKTADHCARLNQALGDLLCRTALCWRREALESKRKS